ECTRNGSQILAEWKKQRLMKSQSSRTEIYSIAALILLLAAAGNSLSADTTAKAKPVLLYSRYYNAEGENRYAPDGVYKDVLDRLRREFDVRIHNEPLTTRTLAGVNLLLIANPN